MGDRFIVDVEGREYRVTEGDLSQDVDFVLDWQEFEAEVIEARKTMQDCCALTQVMTAHGRSAFVERIPNEKFPELSDGIRRVYAWRGGRMDSSLERPSVKFYQVQIDAAAVAIKSMPETIADMQAQADGLLAERNALADLPAYLSWMEEKVQTGGGTVQAAGSPIAFDLGPAIYTKKAVLLEGLQAGIPQAQAQLDAIPAQVASLQANVEAIKVVGKVSVEALAVQVAAAQAIVDEQLVKTPLVKVLS